MKRVFGKKKEKVPAPSLNDASSKIDERITSLDETIKKLDNELRKYKEQLKKAKGPTATRIKQRAMQTLQRKRNYEKQRDQLAGQQFNIQSTTMAIESVQNTVTTVAAMKEATSTLKSEFKKININEVEDIVDDLADEMDDIDEINEIMGRSYGVPDDLDEEDLDAELACLEDELEDELGEDEQVSAPEYMQNPLPTEPSTIPVGENEAVDDYGLPVAQAGTEQSTAQIT